MMNKKAATPETILILAIMTLLLWSTTLFVIAFKNNKTQASVANVRFIEDVYAKEELVQFYFMNGYSQDEIKAKVPEVIFKGDFATILVTLQNEDKDNISVDYTFALKKDLNTP